MSVQTAPSDNHPASWVDPADAYHHLLIESVVNQITNLPTLPTVAAYLLSHLDDDVHLPEVIKMLSYDQVLTAKTLRFANSAFAASQNKTKTVEAAINQMGLKQLRQMVSISAVSGLLVPSKCPGLNFGEFWRHSIGTACCASAIAKHLNVNSNDAFTGGLLHDIGRMVLAVSFPKEYSDVLQYQTAHDCSVLDAEHTVIGIDHVETGVELAKNWNLGQAFEVALIHHHNAKTALTEGLPAIIYLSNLIEHSLDMADGDDVTTNEEILEMWDEIGLGGLEYAAVLKTARKEYQRAIVTLSL